MSAWGDMMRRSSGQLARTEDTIVDTNFSELYPDTMSAYPSPKGLSDFAKQINELKKMKKKIEDIKKQIARLK